ncbi:MAG: caspase family protein [Cyanobacteriota bacterium]|nr:caspase family protein [Cyanobacteriota bacterium]
MGLTRRNFLQQAGFALLALGSNPPSASASNLAASPENSYLQGLSKANGRKLALLVGIDRYPKSKNLSGCITDVELQRELLVQRFGFAPSDVLVLTNQQATREGIETAFVEHLSEQAKAGDTVVFHFSGYGNQVNLPAAGDKETSPPRQTRSLLPFDGLISTKEEPARNDMLLETLMLLAQSLETQQATFILDTSYQTGGQVLQGNLRSRSPLIAVASHPNPQELAFQEQLKGRSDRARKLLERGKVPLGAWLLAATGPQMALEGQWDGFRAGLFTYALVRSVWQATPPITLYTTLARTAEQMGQFSAQQPQLQTSGKLKGRPLTYFASPTAARGAEGAAIAIEDKNTTLKVQLAGLSPAVLEAYQPNSRLSLSLETSPETEAKEVAQLQLRSREGLTATAKVLGEPLPEGFQLQPGLLVRETIRVLPRNVGLRVALAGNLERIERVDATSAFSNIAAVSSVVPAGEGGADCLFGKNIKRASVGKTKEEKSGTASSESTARGYELFSVGQVAVANTAGDPDEAIALAVERLTPKLKALLAIKLLNLTLNEGSSCLKARARLVALEPVPKIPIERATGRSQRLLSVDETGAGTNSTPSSAAIPRLTAGSRIQYGVENGGDSPLYVMVFGIDASGRAIALYAQASDGNTLKPVQVESQPGNTLTLPRSQNSDWRTGDTPGVAQMYLLVSRSPFAKTLKVLKNASYPQAAGEQLQELRDPLEVARSVLQDLHEASAVSTDVLGSASEVYGFDVKAWATFSFVYEVVQG